MKQQRVCSIKKDNDVSTKSSIFFSDSKSSHSNFDSKSKKLDLHSLR